MSILATLSKKLISGISLNLVKGPLRWTSNCLVRLSFIPFISHSMLEDNIGKVASIWIELNSIELRHF